MNSSSMDDLSTRAQIFIGKLLTADFVEAFSQFDDQMKKAINKTKLQESWQNATKDAGTLLQFPIIRLYWLLGYIDGNKL